jgi:hypothetical protein
MTIPPSLQLDADWLVYPPADADPAYGTSLLDDSTWDSLESVSDWPVDRLGSSDGVQLKRRFDLDTIGEVCLRFVLQVDAAPVGTQVYINGWHAGTTEAGKALSSDVTDTVTLEANLIHLKLIRRGPLGGVRLVAIPCPD